MDFRVPASAQQMQKKVDAVKSMDAFIGVFEYIRSSVSKCAPFFDAIFCSLKIHTVGGNPMEMSVKMCTKYDTFLIPWMRFLGAK